MMRRMTTARPLIWILLGGLAVATLDMSVAVSFWASKGVAPMRIFQSVAAGWLGREAAVAGGLATALLGLGSHLAIATAMVAIYWRASLRFSVLHARPIGCGLLYGLATWAAMRFVVVPLSAAPAGSTDLPWQLVHFASHLFIVGLPSAWLARMLAARR